jgi:hypothetical protein
MPSPFAISFRLIAILAFAISLCSTVRSEETAPDKEDNAAILVRVMCKQPVAGATELRIVQGEKVAHDLNITDSLMTEPLPITRGELLLLARQAGDAENPAFEPVLRVTIPNEGNRFALALFASLGQTPAKPYEYRLVRTDEKSFGTSDLYLFNLTTLPVGGWLGKENFTLAANASEVITPAPDQSGGRMYQSRFYCQIDGETRIFNDTRWPLSMTARVYLFFIPDPERQSISYLSFREYEPFP